MWIVPRFTIADGGVEVELGRYVEITRNGPEIQPMRLLDDFSAGWSKYLYDLQDAGEHSQLGNRFANRFEEIFIK